MKNFPIKIGDIVQEYSGYAKVVDVYDNTFALALWEDTIEEAEKATTRCLNVFSFQYAIDNNWKIHRGFTVAEEKWEPKIGDRYWVIELDNMREGGFIVNEYIWSNDSLDRKFKEVGDIFHIKEQAELACKKITQIFKELREK